MLCGRRDGSCRFGTGRVNKAGDAEIDKGDFVRFVQQVRFVTVTLPVQAVGHAQGPEGLRRQSLDVGQGLVAQRPVQRDNVRPHLHPGAAPQEDIRGTLGDNTTTAMPITVARAVC